MLHNHDSHSLQTLVDEEIGSWNEGEQPDASRFLAEHPEVRDAKSLVIDIAVAEYLVRTAAGDEIVPSEFCDRFPAYRQSIAKMLAMHELFDRRPPSEQDSEIWPRENKEFLGFKIVEQMGRGGLAKVFLAHELSLGNRQVVIKVSRFASREADMLGQLSHPSIMPVHSVQRDKTEGWTAICMPFLGAATGIDLLDKAFADGATRDAKLVQRVAEETRPVAAKLLVLPPNDKFDRDLTYQQAIAGIGLQLAEALSAAHKAGILHRDIKPSNILLAWSGRPLLLDFNLSSDAATPLQGIGGTLAYMAPELIASVLTDKGQAAQQFDPRYDIYSLGAVLYELLTGRLPAKPAKAEKLPIDAYQPWLNCKREPLAAIATDDQADPINQPLYNIVQKCLAFDPAERFANADELVAVLRSYLESLKPAPVVDSAPAHHSQPTQPFTKPRTVFTALIALAAVIVLALFASVPPPRSVPAELLFPQGLEEYDAGNYDAAAKTFSRCLELKAGWPEALFARAQAFVQLEQFAKASSDYTALREYDPVWSNTMAGYCSMRMNELSVARNYFNQAHGDGQRNIPFLFNFANVEKRQLSPSGAIKCYSDVIAAEPQNLTAWFNRSLMGASEVRNLKQLPSAECRAQVEQYVDFAPKTFDAPLCAAVVFGEAARKDAAYRPKAVAYLTEAIKRGLPLEVAGPTGYATQLQPLMELVDAEVRETGVHDPSYRVKIGPSMEFSSTADWHKFRRQEKSGASSLARRGG